AFNGQYVVHEGKVIHQNPIHVELLEELTEYSLSNEHPLVYQGFEGMRSSVSDHPYIEAGMGSLKRNHPLEDIDYYKTHPIFQVLLFNVEIEQQVYEKQFDNLRFVRWHEFSCDVMPRNGSKAYGIEKFVASLEIDWKDTYA